MNKPLMNVLFVALFFLGLLSGALAGFSTGVAHCRSAVVKVFEGLDVELVEFSLNETLMIQEAYRLVNESGG